MEGFFSSQLLNICQLNSSPGFFKSGPWMTMYKVRNVANLIASQPTVPTCSLVGQLASLNDRSKTFFTLCRKNNKPELREQQYQNLCQVTVI